MGDQPGFRFDTERKRRIGKIVAVSALVAVALGTAIYQRFEKKAPMAEPVNTSARK